MIDRARPFSCASGYTGAERALQQEDMGRGDSQRTPLPAVVSHDPLRTLAAIWTGRAEQQGELANTWLGFVEGLEPGGDLAELEASFRAWAKRMGGNNQDPLESEKEATRRRLLCAAYVAAADDIFAVRSDPLAGR